MCELEDLAVPCFGLICFGKSGTPSASSIYIQVIRDPLPHFKKEYSSGAGGRFLHIISEIVHTAHGVSDRSPCEEYATKVWRIMLRSWPDYHNKP